MRATWSIALVAVAMASGCGGDDGEGEADRTEALVAEMLGVYEEAAMYRCECLVAQDILYDSVEECLMVLQPKESWGDCVQMAFATDGTEELEVAMRCHTDHLHSAQACAEAAGCEESIAGACDAETAESPCGESMVELLTFVLGHCPDIPMNAQ